uniref:GHMP kinase C-terminal domain-containing protein n=1 Tax=Aplanochytrium stocchinoi TaxID=215587 RepID=A0A7S3PLR7_9STRA|mmetsp:Transcript_20979/g.25454  ORF Transcript_20979/g.25454 Transcript_20979/m.25454 type:complete len:185 (-) Transcript_20979:332-886(-)
MKGETDTLQVFSYHDEVAVLETAIHDFSKHNLKFVVAVSGVSACKTSNAKDRYNALAAQKHLAKHESDVVVPEFVNAFKNYTNKDMIKAAVIKSQAHAENILKITVPETEWLPKKAVSLGALCATAFGAGFGGSVWALVPSETVDIGTFINGWKTSYVKKFHHPSCFVFPTKPSHGAYIKAVKE